MDYREASQQLNNMEQQLRQWYAQRVGGKVNDPGVQEYVKGFMFSRFAVALTLLKPADFEQVLELDETLQGIEVREKIAALFNG